jgi:hypothetical protein
LYDRLVMKKDLVLLSAIAAAVAIAITIAAARLTPPHAWNPLADWSARKSAWAFAIALVATIVSGVAISISDRGLPHPSATLEWVYSGDEAARIVDEYGAQRSQALRGVVLDSVAFIPSYVLLIALGCFCLALHPPADARTAWLITLGWCVVFAGALDYVENAGIFAALGGVTTGLAPLTYVACQLKWLLALTAADFAVMTAIVRVFGR